MKIKTSFTLSKDLIEEIDKLLGRKGNRSTLVEQALRNYLAAQKGQNADPNTLNKADDNVNAQPIERVVQEVVQSHFEIEPEIDEIVWFKSRSNREIRLLEINQDTFSNRKCFGFSLCSFSSRSSSSRFFSNPQFQM